MKIDMITRALSFAAGAHAGIGQKRKYTGEPYINHPLEVYKRLLLITKDEDTLCAAILHDVLEDTKVEVADLECLFNKTVIGYVVSLTDTMFSYGVNRAGRKASDRARLQAAPAEVQTIKLADVISDTKSIVEHDPKFAKTYLAEIALLLEVLTKGDLILMIETKSLLNESLATLTEIKESLK